MATAVDYRHNDERCVLITGASGFVGRTLMARLRALPRPVVGTSRDSRAGLRSIGGMDARTEWHPVLEGVDSVIHLAARVHIMRDTVPEPLAAFRAVNVEGTRKLAMDAAEAGVRRIVFVSSVKVNGERTVAGRPFRPGDVPAPQDPYGQSKWEAEQALQEVAERTGLEAVIIRPPLVYGPGVKANFERLMRWVHLGVPLPFGAVDNRRSMVALDNLVDLLMRCVDHPAAAGQTFLVSDDQDLSTPDLVRRLASAMERSPRLLPVPVPVLRFAGGMAGRGAEVARLCGSLQVDASATRERLGWTPPVRVDEALQMTVTTFLNRHTDAS